MNITIIRNGIQPADRIVIPKSNIKLVQHHAIYLGQNNEGVDLIAENKIGFGVRLVTADEFFKGVIEITRIERFTGTNSERRVAVQRALEQLGRPYDLINYNCESFSNHVQHNEISSRQVGAGIAIAFFALLFGFSFSRA